MMELNTRQTLILALVALFVGRFLVQKIPFLDRNNIPEPVVGGVFFCLINLLVYLVMDLGGSFDLEWRDILLIVFFTCIGLNSSLSQLVKGGKAMVVLLGVMVGYLFIQNLLGVSVSRLLGVSDKIGLLAGSISMSGGHGTAIAWGKVFLEKYQVVGAMEIGAASATFGLVMGGVLGGPLANWLINKYKLKSNTGEKLEVGVANEKGNTISAFSVFTTLLTVAIAMGMGTQLKEFLDEIGIQLPAFVSSLFCGIFLTNTIPLIFKKVAWPTGTDSLALLSEISLGLFLAMSLMSLQLWTLVDIAGPMLLILILQVVSVLIFSSFVVYRVMGKDYDAAVITAGFVGISLGATPTALVNMTAVAKKHGASHLAFLIIPLVGAFFIDLANSLVITLFLNFP
ncbi:sodium/glutamate symporter [Algoriphagus sp. A40]|uniref:sodium/glutamate symporter n=1 Tax=Algoriphagus sp. A40 TaxID=1945863 RepID=UPI001C2C2ED0|nr:sodium/glutamate symporter [Algoriphagus sp. A40]